MWIRDWAKILTIEKLVRWGHIILTNKHLNLMKKIVCFSPQSLGQNSKFCSTTKSLPIYKRLLQPSFFPSPLPIKPTSTPPNPTPSGVCTHVYSFFFFFAPFKGERFGAHSNKWKGWEKPIKLLEEEDMDA